MVPLDYKQQASHRRHYVHMRSAAHVHIAPSHLDWAPTVVKGDIPANAVFSDAPVVAYASLNDFASNFGHALFDFLFPVFNILQLLNLYTPDFQLLLADHQVRPCAEAYTTLAGVLQWEQNVIGILLRPPSPIPPTPPPGLSLSPLRIHA